MTYPPRTATCRRARADAERGDALEAVIGGFVFALIVVVLAVAYVARSSSNHVEDAAREAARNAAARADAPDAIAIAERTVHAALDEFCAAVDVTSDVSAFHAGGSVTITVTCTAPLTRLGSIAGSNHIVVSAATEVIDHYRGGI